MVMKFHMLGFLAVYYRDGKILSHHVVRYLLHNLGYKLFAKYSVRMRTAFPFPYVRRRLCDFLTDILTLFMVGLVGEIR